MRSEQISIEDFLKACKKISDSHGTMEDVGKLLGRTPEYVSTRLSNIKRERPGLAVYIDALTLERAPAGRRKIEQKLLVDILMGNIG